MRNSTKFSDGSARVFEDTDLRCEDAAGHRANPAADLDAAYQRALQALRDVRHMLPPDGFAIVDAFLDGPSFAGEGQDVGLFALSALFAEAQSFSPTEESDLLDSALLN